MYGIMSHKQKLSTWAGVGIKGGGFLGFFGAESTYGRLFSLYDASYQSGFSLTNARIGLGLGGGAGAVFLLVFNCPNIWRINGDPSNDWGVNIAMGQKWSELVTVMKYQRFIPAVAKLAEQIRRTNSIHVLGFQETFRNVAHYAYNLFDYEAMDKKLPKVMSIEVPFSGKGVEISASYSFGGRIYITA